MPRNKVLERAKVNIQSGRSAFDLSQVRSFDALAGNLNVAYCQQFVKGTKGRISRRCFTRTAAVVSPAFHDVTEHFDFFLVPIHSLWRMWENWKLNINDLQDTNQVKFDTSNVSPVLTLPASAPRMDFNHLVTRYTGQGLTQAQADAKARKLNEMLSLCDSLGYSEKIVGDANLAHSNSRIMNVLFLAAYQKVYFDHYRNTAYESNNPYAYNMDCLYSGSANDGLLQPNQTRDSYMIDQLCTMRRVNYRNDYFHNVYPALNYVSSLPSVSFTLPSGVADAAVAGQNPNNQPYLYANLIANQLSPSASAVSSSGYSLSVQQIRAIFALDKLMRAAAYAPKHVREQYKAQFGVDGHVYDSDMVSQRICSFQSNVQFQEVTNMTNNTPASTTSTLGNVGAKGVGGDQKDKFYDFYCEYDSILIGLHYFMPRARYDAFGVHPFNTQLLRSDFFVRAFERLGLRPMYVYNINADYNYTFNGVIGWTVPNHAYKILPDLNTGIFKTAFGTAFAQQESGQTTYEVYYTDNAQSELSTYVPHTQEVIQSPRQLPISADYFKVAPEDLNNIFQVAVESPHVREVCQFYGQFRISVPVVAPMSVHGQPSV